MHRDERDARIKYLADKYPKCFFEDPHQRRPLKHNIIEDLEKENVLNHEALVQVLDWYKNHFAYRYAIIAGADRIDLDGNKAGTVTPREQAEAREWVVARKKQLNELRAIAPVTLVTHVTGARNTMAMKSTTTAAAAGAGAPIKHPQLAEIQAAITLADGFIGALLTTSFMAAATIAVRSDSDCLSSCSAHDVLNFAPESS
jgi:sRNA-binding protein